MNRTDETPAKHGSNENALRKRLCLSSAWRLSLTSAKRVAQGISTPRRK